jgi:hypothetical protein
MTQNHIHRDLLSDDRRVSVPAKLFGTLAFPFKVEPTIFNMAGRLSTAYRGGFWDMHQLSNGGWYMSPSSEAPFSVASQNGYSGEMSADALGITACMFAFSHLCLGGDALAEVCAEQFHLLREFALDHPEAKAILAAIN